MQISIFQVDAFTDKAFQGNPAAVCVLPEPKDEEWMQNVAMEMNLSETAFLVPQLDGYQLRWFTPSTEVDICGHATLASAHVLWENGYLSRDLEARFHTRSGLLKAKLQGEWLQLDFPSEYPERVEVPEEITKALKLKPIYAGKSRYYLLEVESEEMVRSCKPDFILLKEVSDRGVIVTSRSESGEFDFVSRFFDPVDGIDEDPVTGSAHCLLTPYWGRKLGKANLTAYQASARGGILKVNLAEPRVLIAGQAVTVFRGNLPSYIIS